MGEEGVGVTVCVCVYLIISTVFWCSQLNNVFPGTSDAEPDSNARQHSLKQEAMNSQGRASGKRCLSLPTWGRSLCHCVCVCVCLSVCVSVYLIISTVFGVVS